MKPAQTVRTIIFTVLAGLWTYFLLEFFEEKFIIENPFHIIAGFGYIASGYLMMIYQFKKSAHQPHRIAKKIKRTSLFD